MGRRSEWQALNDAVQAAGWKVRRSRHGLLCTPTDPDCRPVLLAGTPSDWRAVRNCAAALRRAGLHV